MAGGKKWPPPSVRYLTKEDGIIQVSSHLSLLELTHGKYKKSAPRSFLKKQ